MWIIEESSCVSQGQLMSATAGMNDTNLTEAEHIYLIIWIMLKVIFVEDTRPCETILVI